MLTLSWSWSSSFSIHLIRSQPEFVLCESDMTLPPLSHSFNQLSWQSEVRRPKMDGDSPLHRCHPFLSLFLSLLDHTVINFHGVDTVRQYILTLINIVRWWNVKRDKKDNFSFTSAIYGDPTLGANLKFVILRMIFYEGTSLPQICLLYTSDAADE